MSYSFTRLDKKAYEEALRTVSGDLSPKHGRLILDLFFTKPSKRLTRIARRWVSIYPGNPYSARILAAWIEEFPKDETLDLSEQILKTVSPGTPLALLMAAILEKKSRNRSLLRLVEEMLEKFPSHHMWFVLLGDRTKNVERITSRWIDLNEYSSDVCVFQIAPYLHRTALAAKLAEILVRTGLRGPKTPHYIDSLLRNLASFDASRLRKVAHITRKWLEANPSNEFAGELHASLISYCGSKSDVRRAREWFVKSASHEQKWWVLNALLEASEPHVSEGDKKFAIVSTKKLLKQVEPGELLRLIGNALATRPKDPEIIILAEKAYAQSRRIWLLADLLMVAPDHHLVNVATKSIEIVSPIAVDLPKLLCALLSVDPSNRTARACAKRLIKQSQQTPNSRNKTFVPSYYKRYLKRLQKVLRL